MTTKWKLVPIEPTEEMVYAIATRAHCGDSGGDIWSEALAWAPQPPALGGEPEVLAWTTNGPDPVFQERTIHHLWGSKCQAEKHLKSTNFYKGWKVGELIDRAHVVPLLAEIDSERTLRRNLAVRVHELKDELKDVQQERDTLKARCEELERLVVKAERTPYAAGQEIREYFSRQAAPAAKDGAQ